jgi:hypothetical protein
VGTLPRSNQPTPNSHFPSTEDLPSAVPDTADHRPRCRQPRRLLELLLVSSTSPQQRRRSSTVPSPTSSYRQPLRLPGRFVGPQNESQRHLDDPSSSSTLQLVQAISNDAAAHATSHPIEPHRCWPLHYRPLFPEHPPSSLAYRSSSPSRAASQLQRLRPFRAPPSVSHLGVSPSSSLAPPDFRTFFDNSLPLLSSRSSTIAVSHHQSRRLRPFRTTPSFPDLGITP